MKRYAFDDPGSDIDGASMVEDADGEYVRYEDAIARISLLERASRAANEAVEGCEGTGLLYCMGRVSPEAVTVAQVLATSGEENGGE